MIYDRDNRTGERCRRLFFLAVAAFILVFCSRDPLPMHEYETLARENPLSSFSYFTDTATVSARVSFVLTGSMVQPRESHAATLLQTGDVLITGGQAPDPSSAELYNSGLGLFAQTGSMSTGRVDHSATLLPDGQVLLTGGYNISADLYDPMGRVFTSTGGMEVPRNGHTATLLNNELVLIAGGSSGGTATNVCELYDPSTGTFTMTGTLVGSRHRHTATLLQNGKVLLAGGFRNDVTVLNTAELYDPVTGTFTATGHMSSVRASHSAALLPDGRVLIAGGRTSITNMLATAEVYDPGSGTFTLLASTMSAPRGMHEAERMDDGRVLLLAGIGNSGGTPQVDLFDPSTNQFSVVGSVVQGRYQATTTRLDDGRILVAGGFGAPGSDIIASAEIGTYMPPNVFTGTLALPTEWTNAQLLDIYFSGESRESPLCSAILSSTNQATDWISVTAGITASATLDVGQDGFELPVYLRLRDQNGQHAKVVTGTVNIDTTAPTSSMNGLPSESGRGIMLSWTGVDTLSGVAGYDIEVRDGVGGAWTSMGPSTIATMTTFSGEPTHTYYFRARAIDSAGNVEAWPADYDTMTYVQDDQPALAIVKWANTGFARVGEVITYSYQITNTGNVAMTDLMAYDDRLGSLSLDASLLAPDAWTVSVLTYTVTQSDLPGPLINTVVVTGTSLFGDMVTNTDSFAVSLLRASTHIYLPLLVKNSR